MARWLFAIVIILSVLEKKDMSSHNNIRSGGNDKCYPSSTSNMNEIQGKLSDVCLVNEEPARSDTNDDAATCSSSWRRVKSEPAESVQSVHLDNTTKIEREVVELKDKLSQIRVNEYSFYGQHLLKKGLINNNNTKDLMFSVLTYNVLSQTLLEQHPYLYRQHDSSALKWKYRKLRLLEEFEELNADIICLQELQSDQLNEFYDKHLTAMGYTGFYKKRTHDRVDGCGIYFRTNKFKSIKFVPVEFYRPGVAVLDRDNVGVIVKLAFKHDPDKQFVVGTTHLLYNPRRSDIKLAQTQLFLAELDKISYIDYDHIKQHPNYLPIILTGDMNYVPESPIYQLITQNEIRYEGKSSKYLEEMNDGFKLNKTLIPKHVGVADSCQFEVCIKERNKDEKVVYQTGRLRHRMNFATVFDHYHDDVQEVTTHQDQWVTVDYMFYSQDTDKHDGKLQIVSRLKLPTNDDAIKYLKHLPNPACASDHLPLLATFHLTS